LNDIMRASDAIQAKRFAEGQAILENLMRSDPQLYLAPFLLGEAALEQRDWVRARRQLERCLELNPRFDAAMTALARSLAESGDQKAAADWLHKALDTNAANYRAWYQLGRLQISSEPENAISAFEKALTIQPAFALAHRDLGLLQMQRKDYAAAVQHLAEAEKGGAGSAELSNSLGIAYSQTKNGTAAIRSFERSIALNPNLAEAHLNLAFELQKAGRFSRARIEYADACRLESRLCRYVPN
jgi:tetratricopeptide (TPR) repeat protein